MWPAARHRLQRAAAAARRPQQRWRGVGGAALAGGALAGGGAARCEAPPPPPGARRTPLPPRPVPRALRPELDPRVDPSMLMRFDPPEHLRTGAAFVVLPGGNYEKCSMLNEGQKVAVWLNSLGITAFVLRYRCIPEGHYWPAPMEDLELAMRLVRASATEWRVDRARVGVIGFSAGGHLAGAAAGARDGGVRPDAQVLVYPCVDCTKPAWWPWRPEEGHPPPEESLHLLVHAEVPPAFLAVSTQDGLCTAEDNTVPYEAALAAAGVPVEHVVCPMGKHGHGVRPEWAGPCEAWLRRLGWAAAGGE